MRWLLNHVPTLALGVMIVGGTVVLTMVAFRWVRRRGFTLGEESQALEPFLAIVGAVYGVVLAFVIVDLWAQFHEARATVSAETAALEQVAIDIRPLNDSDRKRIETAISEYIDVTVNEEWHMMKRGLESPHAHLVLDELALAMEHTAPHSPTAEIWYAEAVTNFNQVVAGRRDRIEAVRREIPLPFKVLLFGGAVVPIWAIMLVAVRSKIIHGLMVLSVAVLVSYAVFLAVILDYPFSGTVSVSTAPYHQGVLDSLAPDDDRYERPLGG